MEGCNGIYFGRYLEIIIEMLFATNIIGISSFFVPLNIDGSLIVKNNPMNQKLGEF